MAEGSLYTLCYLITADRARRHHAFKSQASGFCYVADCVLAIMALKRSRIALPDGGTRRPRIMYLDLDLHFSDGVSQAFLHSARGSSSPQVLTFSIHHSAPGFFPSSPLSSLTDPSDPTFDPFTLSLPLNRGASDSSFYSAWKSVEMVKNAFRPDYVVLQCGADGLAGDPYAVWNWSLGTSEGSMGWCIDRICHHWGCKVLLLGGGKRDSIQMLFEVILCFPSPKEDTIRPTSREPGRI